MAETLIDGYARATTFLRRQGKRTITTQQLMEYAKVSYREAYDAISNHAMNGHAEVGPERDLWVLK